MLVSSIKQFKYYKQLADKAMDQLPDESMLLKQLNKEDNSIAIIIQHMAGNMKSRWTNIFTEDGEKEWRNRDAEFESIEIGKDTLIKMWEDGWRILFDTLQSLSEDDLEKIIYIRNEGLTVSDAIIRQLCHYSYHCGQIVSKCKLLSDGKWQSLSIPRNKSIDYNQKKFSQEKKVKHFLDDMLDKENKTV